MRSWLRIGITGLGVLTLLSSFLMPARSSAQVGAERRMMILNLQPGEGQSDRFGRDVARELRRLVSQSGAHEPIEEREVRDAARQWEVDVRRLDCVLGLQLANLMDVHVVFCGNYAENSADQTVTTTGVGFTAPGGSSFDIEDRTWGRRDARQAAAFFVEQLASFVERESRATFCGQYYEAKDWASAEDNCTIALELDPENNDVRYVWANLLNDTDRPEEAYREVLRVIEADRFHENALSFAGHLAVNMDRKDEARGHYEALLELDPDNAVVRMNVAYNLAQEGDAEGAMILAGAGLDIDPDNVDLLELYAGFATSAARDIMVAQPPGAGLTMDAGNFFMNAKDAYERAYQIKGVEMESVHLRNMIATLNQLEQLDEAAELAERVLETHGDEAQFWSIYADVLNKIGRVADALTALETLASLEPEYPLVNVRRGTWLLDAGREDEALPFLQQAVESGEQSADQVANNIWASAYTKGVVPLDWEYAIRVLGMAKTFDDQLSDRMSGQIDFWYGYALYNQTVVLEEPETLQTAELTLPKFEQVKQILGQAKVSAYAEAQSLGGNLDEVKIATQRYIEIQEALIERGRRR